MPPAIRADLADEAAPPGFMLVEFATREAREWVEARLGPSIEPDYSYDLKALRCRQIRLED